MKRGSILLVVLFLILVMPIVLAEENSSVNKAYSCLESKVGDCDLNSAEERAFSLLALSYKSSFQSDCKSALMTKSDDDECWPESGCRLRDTAIALLALENINADTDKPKDWLLEQRKAPDLDWFLEIDSSSEATCKITYSGSTYTIIVGADKKINKAAGSCLSLANSNYWLKISSNCLEKNFTISCNQNFVTAVLYQKTGDTIWHVSSITNSESADGETQEQVQSYCFEQNNQCNYEGSLWATLALSKAGEDIKSYLPYLVAYTEDNKKFSPYSFLYLLTGEDDYFSKMFESQNSQGYWDLSSGYKRFYDTAANLISLSSTSEGESGKQWLLDNQDSSGCWNNGNIRDTAFILYAIAPKTTVSVSTGCPSSDYCITSGECTEANGDVLDEYDCTGLKVCCNKPAVVKTCTEQLGTLCTGTKTCLGTEVPSSEIGTCCIGNCEEPAQPSECEEKAYICKSLCSDDEEDKGFSCDSSSDFCCGTKSSSPSYWWIWVLVILIILIVIAIIFRDRLRLFIFKFKSRFKSGKLKTSPRPPFPPSVPLGRTVSRPVFRQVPPQVRRTQPSIDKELEDTLKKLREMGK